MRGPGGGAGRAGGGGGGSGRVALARGRRAAGPASAALRTGPGRAGGDRPAMGTPGAGRKRLPNRERLTAEDDALNQIAREVSGGRRHRPFSLLHPPPLAFPRAPPSAAQAPPARRRLKGGWKGSLSAAVPPCPALREGRARPRSSPPVRGVHRSRCSESRWAGVTTENRPLGWAVHAGKSWNRSVARLDGIPKIISLRAPCRETPSSRAGCSEPCPSWPGTLPGMGERNENQDAAR